ncbi:dimethylhistidine N-methyltransferase [Williamsia sp. Leaf354]|uniref:L-histidine N(alpha)-methyltransferase n=1 Tax=Williamsia sp. Leaf354 TaxID=1736349 RepID=UPI0006F5853B|nr:L-histidine N(alpha)-methyltransferase [Williamsia sp. Leaf354]KQR99646.1 dimethylhistidine N-methyltransferase [Williamsia sp. Leaf354]
MSHPVSTEALEIHINPDEVDEALVTDVRAGLTASPKHLPPKWFYDQRGSELFEVITTLDEYYPTRTEKAILAAHADDIAAATGMTTLVELGSGSSEKTRLLLDAGIRAGTLTTYVPQDVSVTALQGAVDELAVEYPDLRVAGIVSDFIDTAASIPDHANRTVAFLGGTLGNLVPADRAAFLTGVAAALRPGEHLIIGVGLVVDESIVVPAYDDARGVTADFNRNVLAVINRRLGGDFDLDGFDHVAMFDTDNEWIEMRLRARRAMTVRVRDLDLEVEFAEGEQMRTEISAKFRRSGITEELTAAGFGVEQIWTDPDDRFAVVLAEKH